MKNSFRKPNIMEKKKN